MDSLVRRLLEHGFSKEELRNELLKEAGQRFTPGSCASVIFEFYKAIRSYYSYLLGHEFQLYSDRPNQFFNVVNISVDFEDDDHFKMALSAGNNNAVDDLENLNSYKPEEISTFTMLFVLSPQLKDLVASIENDRYKDLFNKTRKFYVSKGDGTLYEGIFEPEWTDEGLLIRLSGLNHNESLGTDLMRTYGYF